MSASAIKAFSSLKCGEVSDVLLMKLVNAITNISANLLRDPSLMVYRFSVAQRLSWAAGRETTRVEDRAYSLLGIFDINMPTLYGEGEGAFQRLQEEILRSIPDQSLFAWAPMGVPPSLPLSSDSGTRFKVSSLSSRYSSPFLTSPDRFVGGQSIEVVPLNQLFYYYPDLPAPDYTFTPLGIRAQIPFIPLSAVLPDGATLYFHSERSEWYLAVLGCEHADRPGHLLARVCYVPSSPSGVQIFNCGVLSSISPGHKDSHTELVTLSPETLARTSALVTIAMVFLPPPTSRPSALSARDMQEGHPHKAIHLLLKRKGKTETLRSNGSRLLAGLGDEPVIATRTLRWPDQDHPTTHWLTISRPPPQHMMEDVRDVITIEYRHTLENNGDEFTIDAYLTGKLGGCPIIPVMTSWKDQRPWGKWEYRKTVGLDNGRNHAIEMQLSLEYLAPNHYLIDAHTEWYISIRSPHPEDSDSDLKEEHSLPVRRNGFRVATVRQRILHTVHVALRKVFPLPRITRSKAH